MNILAATGPHALPMENLRNLLAASATFQSLQSTATVAVAKAAIHYGEVDDRIDGEDPDSIISPFPRAILNAGETSAPRVAYDEFDHTGTIELSIEAMIPQAYWPTPLHDTSTEKREKPANAAIWWSNQTGAIQSELEANSGNSDGSGNPYLNVTNITVQEGPLLLEGDEMPETFDIEGEGKVLGGIVLEVSYV